MARARLESWSSQSPSQVDTPSPSVSSCWSASVVSSQSVPGVMGPDALSSPQPSPSASRMHAVVLSFSAAPGWVAGSPSSQSPSQVSMPSPSSSTQSNHRFPPLPLLPPGSPLSPPEPAGRTGESRVRESLVGTSGRGRTQRRGETARSTDRLVFPGCGRPFIVVRIRLCSPAMHCVVGRLLPVHPDRSRRSTSPGLVGGRGREVWARHVGEGESDGAPR